MTEGKKICVLFDIDGTLTPSRRSATEEILNMIKDLRKIATVGVVGGSDLPKQKDQLGKDVLDLVDYSFSENGLVSYHGHDLIGKTSFIDKFSKEDIKRLVNWTLRYIADLDIPQKSGTFFELRTGMVNISPVGRNCTYEQRMEFFELDKKKKYRQTMVEKMREEFKDLNLQFSIGGQTSFDVFPVGWSKAYCLKFVEGKFDEIHFFGDMTMEGGNDYEIAHDPRVISHTVCDPEDTIKQVKELFLNH